MVRKGFTLIEMIIVIVLIAIITTVGAQVYSNVLLKKKIDGTVEYVAQIVKVIETYRANEIPTLLYKCWNDANNNGIAEPGEYDNPITVDCLINRGVPIGKSPFNTDVTISTENNDRVAVLTISNVETDACQQTCQKINDKSGYSKTQNASNVLYYAVTNDCSANKITVKINGYKL
ncbi:MAG: prepilin-type N-terminal cleavage/methylation domain-containing protein [Nitrososphaerota archaeon]